MSTLKDEFDLLDPVDRTQAAYDESARVMEFADVDLQPWTCARHGVAIGMGSEVVQALGPQVAPFLSGGSYPNRYRDVVIVLWLCSLDRERIKLLAARPAPELQMIEAYEWADSVGATYGSKLFFEGLSLLNRIVRDILGSIFAVDGSDGAEVKKKATDPLGKSNTHSEQSELAGTTPTTS